MPTTTPRRLIVGGGRAPGFPAHPATDVTLNVDPRAEPDHLGDVASIPFPDAHFTAVVGERLPFEAVIASERAGAELIRVVRPGGSIRVTTGPGVPVRSVIERFVEGGATYVAVHATAPEHGVGIEVRRDVRDTTPRFYGSLPAWLAVDGRPRPRRRLGLSHDAVLSPGNLETLVAWVVERLEQLGSRQAAAPARVLHRVDENLRGSLLSRFSDPEALVDMSVHWETVMEKHLDPLRQTRAPLDGLFDATKDAAHARISVRESTLAAARAIAPQMSDAALLESAVNVAAALDGVRNGGGTVRRARNESLSERPLWRMGMEISATPPPRLSPLTRVTVPAHAAARMAWEARRQDLTLADLLDRAVTALAGVAAVTSRGETVVATDAALNRVHPIFEAPGAEPVVTPPGRARVL